jgi:hypothetical protein
MEQFEKLGVIAKKIVPLNLLSSSDFADTETQSKERETVNE